MEVKVWRETMGALLLNSCRDVEVLGRHPEAHGRLGEVSEERV